MASVQVGCKIPNGLQMNLYGKGADNFPIVEKAHILKGSHQARIAGGYGITEIDKDFWDAWEKQNKNHPAVKAGFVFALGDEKSVEAKAKEMKDEKTGLEGLNPDKPADGIKPDESMEAILKKIR